MNRITVYTFNQIIIGLLFLVVMSCNTTEDADFEERTKIALRDAGNKLLLSQQDSTSLILPVVAIDANNYQLSFDRSLSFEPTTLVNILQQSIKASQLPEHYLVEVLQCSDMEVAYSYQMSVEDENTIIPCAGRYLPDGCYMIEVKFLKIIEKFTITDALIRLVILFALIAITFLIRRKLQSKNEPPNQQYNGIEKLGSFYFYPEQNKLVKEAVEIALSKKECELLELFVARPNEIIKRDELTKRVWEDNGVFVGRSLDTYISKLRKKLKSDTSIKLTNVHGIGYKLEVE
jgi:hypothetical protein